MVDAESASWLNPLGDTGVRRYVALARLHEMLLRVARYEAYQRGPVVRISGPELDDIAVQAADDAMVALLSKLATFRGESRFTSWAYRFVVLEVKNKIGRNVWRSRLDALDTEEWDRLPADRAIDPLSQAIQRELISAVRRAVDETLTEHQRRVFVAIVVHGTPLDTVVSESGSNRNAIYKTVFDARRKIRAFLTVNGYLEG
ncbi:sigma-70 family RNA polymerase sigma factor [Diaminobutyricibacter tongyongensis]|uniref:sigma-70 family RNA polymerase sigma factor n=1 Tax=Leifsonia tongyongensis TaxID=1268043 RepID=UPI001965A97F